LLLLGVWAGGASVHAETAATQPEPATDQPVLEPPRRPSAVEILQELRKKQQARPVIMPSTPGEGPGAQVPVETTRQAVSPMRKDRPLRPDGTMVVDRIGRLVRRAKGWYFFFESEGKVLREPPMQILPNRDLETMEITSANGTRPVKFRISGEVTEYRGANYLLLRKVLIVHDLGNLK
jgi:hypothetical protein